MINKFLAEPIKNTVLASDSQAEDVFKIESMEHQLTDLYSQKELLISEIGISEPREIISMIKNLEAQLQDLYSEKEKVLGPSEESLPNAGFEMQLNDLYAEKEQLYQNLKVNSAAEILNMVESMNSQLVDLYSDLENAVVVEGKKITIMGARKLIIKKQS